MENQLRVDGTNDKPTIHFEKDSGLLKISGRSLPEDAFSYYKPIIDWVSEYLLSPANKTTLIINLEYFNTASAKQLFKIISLIHDLGAKFDVQIQWHYDKGDRDMLNSGERFSKLCARPFEFIEN
ncbi:MAG: DUF1987 domain-containing protein [Sphingobacteriaceae bacterium]|nr:DUF1987 domain-containing protein [Sphingobacteriaceae bacterium]